MRVRMLGSVLAAVFSTTVAFGTLGGSGLAGDDADTSDSGWTGVEADSGWTIAPADSGWTGVLADSGWTISAPKGMDA